MQEIVDRAVDIALPGAVISALPGKVVNHSSLSKYQCALDGALVMLQRFQLREEPSDIYLLADSSPQATYNFLLTAMLSIPHRPFRLPTMDIIPESCAVARQCEPALIIIRASSAGT